MFLAVVVAFVLAGPTVSLCFLLIFELASASCGGRRVCLTEKDKLLCVMSSVDVCVLRAFLLVLLFLTAAVLFVSTATISCGRRRVCFDWPYCSLFCFVCFF